MGYKHRDVEVIPLEGDQYLVIACDSCGGIGLKEFDIVKVPPSLVGRLTLRVALLEVLAAGAHLKGASVAISCEPFPTGEGILQGVRDELQQYQQGDLPIAVSTEKNIPTGQTGVGITIIGICKNHELRIGKSRPDDDIYCVGIPKVGHEVTGADDPLILQVHHIHALLANSDIHDILPVGSGGILKEAHNLAAAIDRSFIVDNSKALDMEKSAGPSTCAVFSCSPGTSLPDFDCTPLNRIGRLE